MGPANYGRRLLKRGDLIDGIMKMPVAGRRTFINFARILASLGPFKYLFLLSHAMIPVARKILGLSFLQF